MRPAREKMRPAFSAKQLVLPEKPPSCHPSGVSVSHPGASSARSASSATYFPLLFHAREGRPKQPACRPYLRAPLSLKLVNDTLNHLSPYKLTYVKYVRKHAFSFRKEYTFKKNSYLCKLIVSSNTATTCTEHNTRAMRRTNMTPHICRAARLLLAGMAGITAQTLEAQTVAAGT